MESRTDNFRQAVQDFHQARQRAAFEEILARMTGKPNQLLSYEEVAQKLKLQGRAERGIQTIPVKAIVGSVGRYTDFTRTFLPRKAVDEDRWARVKASLDDNPIGWPPIEVYKVGEAYFVLDGNHRVSIARQEGWETIEARVIEVKTNVPLTPDVSPDDLIIKAEYAEFLDETQLHTLRPDADLSVSIPGQYDKLREYIQVHRYFMGLDFQRDISYEEALTHWYDTEYLPLVNIIRERGLLRWFPERTETDLYLWLSEHRAALQEELGWQLRPDAVADVILQEQAGESLDKTGAWRQARLIDRYTEHLFHDILVPVSGEVESWRIVKQAILIAQREGATLKGLHVVRTEKQAATAKAQEVKERFEALCREAGVNGSLAIESGEPARKILERAILTDLVMLKIVYPPGSGLSGLASPLRAIISRSPRPVLALPTAATELDRAVLAFDGGAKSKEALFVAAYLAERWHTALTVFTGEGSNTATAQETARQYLELHEIQADYVVGKASPETLKRIAQEHQANLILMGGYSGALLKEVTLGSWVNYMLREQDAPVLICR
ncbi:MAG: universal stress protein [Anaerolineales bacterium]|nr:universal stress protein [Anaerolineales bacterium]MCX7755601.1 universal stress protein [Anaerolineales bacterium]MDW8277599.1 universal stress protein [Anaerolineales bacterium]